MVHLKHAFTSFSLEKLLSQLATDIGRVSRIRMRTDMFGKLFITLCLWTLQSSLRIHWLRESSSKNLYLTTEFLCVNILVLTMFWCLFQGLAQFRHHGGLNPLSKAPSPQIER